MKKTLALTTLLTLAIGAYAPARAQGPYDRRADAHKDIQTALADAQDDGKLVLLDFGANWCLDCIVLSHLFEDQTVRPFLDGNFHVVSVDVGNWDRNLDLSQRYGSPIDGGIPALVILARSGEVVASTKNGALADARTATAREVLDYLKGWVALKPTHAAAR
jgi:thioredoxin 1